MSLRVGEHRERHHLHLGPRPARFAPRALDVVQRGLRIGDTDVERRMTGTALGLADAAADAGVGRIGHAVVHLGCRHVELPTEDVAVEAAQLLAVLPDYFEPTNSICHLVLLATPRFPRLIT